MNYRKKNLPRELFLIELIKNRFFLFFFTAREYLHARKYPFLAFVWRIFPTRLFDNSSRMKMEEVSSDHGRVLYCNFIDVRRDNF